MLQLQCSTVYQITYHKDAVLLKHRMTWRMTICCNGDYATRKRITGLEKMQMPFIGFKHSLCLTGLFVPHLLPCFSLHAIDI